MGVLEYRLLFLRVFYAGLHFVGDFLSLEVYRMPQILLAFKDMDNGICRPSVRVIGVVAAGAARPAVFQRPRRGDFLLGEHTGDFGRAVPGKAQAEYLLDYRGGFLVNDKASVLAF